MSSSVRVGKQIETVDSSVVRKLDKLSSSEMSRKAEHFDANVNLGAENQKNKG
jgi:hypothetical protein